LNSEKSRLLVEIEAVTGWSPTAWCAIFTNKALTEAPRRENRSSVLVCPEELHAVLSEVARCRRGPTVPTAFQVGNSLRLLRLHKRLGGVPMWSVKRRGSDWVLRPGRARGVEHGEQDVAAAS
jgi:hypothetical protein